MDLLRSGLLDGRAVLVAGADELSEHGHEALAACEALGAGVARLAAGGDGDVEEQERITGEAVVQAIARLGGSADVLVVDGESLLADDSEAALGACMQAAWDLARASAERSFIASGEGGRVLLLAPNERGGAHARAAAAALENLARTLSIEWARYAITAVAIAPGERTEAGEVARLCAFLASRAGDYFSGCLLDLRGPRAAAAPAAPPGR
jgi:NAD(P)-dependent dehydrogenase (short-subunit alcohol dehydrogenase family)